MSATELTALIVAAIGALGAVALQALQMYFSYKRDLVLKSKAEEVASTTRVVESKLDTNTSITKTNIKQAHITKEAVESLDKKLNGGIDAAVESAVRPLRKILDEHSSQDEQNMKEIKDKLEELKTKIDNISVAKDSGPNTSQTYDGGR